VNPAISKIIFLIFSYVYNIQSFGEDEHVLNYSTMKEAVLFNPRGLKYMSECDQVDSLGCVTDFVVDYNDSENVQIYSISGRSSRSSLRVLKHGLSVTNLNDMELANPIAVWSLKDNISDQYDKYIIISDQKGDTTVFERTTEHQCKFVDLKIVIKVATTGIKLNKLTLHVGLLEDNTIIQIIPTGILHIDKDKKARLYETKSRVLSACSNYRQIVVALEDKSVVYFELEDDKLAMYERKSMDSEVNIILIFR
jgi:splicing factor 3B subunit 3